MNVELADILIWGGFTVIVLRFAIPKILEMLGLPVTKKSVNDGGADDR